MTRNLVTSWMLLLMLASAAWSQAKPAGAVAEKPIISVVLPSADALFEDMKMALDLAEDPKAYSTLEETISVFLDGIDTTKPSGDLANGRGGDDGPLPEGKDNPQSITPAAPGSEQRQQVSQARESSLPDADFTTDNIEEIAQTDRPPQH